ncbi:glycosyltransferase family 4 protein [Deinococcus deserti]|uniref:Putative Lipopolysaccharide biosynthesis protein (Glycosyltransferase) n=2 Tax=Deinococcus TaxID=1298 RepID=C1CUH7_DEIDV|nr:putative Lipopolysaccharide biosynthesis protein (glycosyltransferase) [Deinococcus deserti VCD115]
MLEVAFLTDAPRVAGSEVWLSDLLPLLPEHGVQPTLYLPQRETLDRFAAGLEGGPVRVRRYTDTALLPELTRSADLRVVQAWEPATYRALLPALAAPRLVVSHDQLDYHYPPPLRALYREIYRHTKAGAFRAADGVVTVSHWGAEFLRGSMGLSATQAMTNGADPERFRPATGEERASLRESLGFTRFTVLVPGRFTLEKNQLAAVRAARHAPQLDFVFVGDMDAGMGVMAQALARRLRLSNVRFLGRRWDMPELYRAADALLQPTLAENQSLVTLEAMSSGLPVVTTPIPAQAELVRDGVDGLLVPPQPALLARALKALAAHPDRARQVGASARQQVLDGYTRAGSAAQLAALLHTTCQSLSGGST